LLYVQENNDHWLLGCIDFRTGNIQIFDSLIGTFEINQHQAKVKLLMKYVESMHKMLHGGDLPSKWYERRYFLVPMLC